MVYGMCKAALLRMTRSMALDLSGRDINCNCIAPGYIDSRVLPPEQEHMRGENPKGEMADEIADAYWDDLSGKRLNESGVRKARSEELGELAKHGVYTKVPVSQCWNRTGSKPIGTRWVDVNKGDDKNPDYRSRLVAQEINNEKRDGLFAATPPIEAKKALFSMAGTKGIGYPSGHRERGNKIDFIDVRRAYFHAKARREVYVELPAEDRDEGMCGRLNKALYGTRDAAQNWEHEYRKFMIEAGFTGGITTPCAFLHKGKAIRVVVHGDDFTVLGESKQLDWFRGQIAARFEVKFRGRIGPAPGDEKSIRILNRVVEWTDTGIHYEADQRHAEIIISELSLGRESKSVSTPSVAAKEPCEEPLPAEQAVQYRAIAARANYLSMDHVDIGFAVKEICRHMSNPKRSDWERIKRLGRYLLGSQG